MQQLISMARCNVFFSCLAVACVLFFTSMPSAMACVVAKDCPPCGSAEDTNGHRFSSMAACQANIAANHPMKTGPNHRRIPVQCYQKSRVCAKGNGRSHSKAGCACYLMAYQDLRLQTWFVF